MATCQIFRASLLLRGGLKVVARRPPLQTNYSYLCRRFASTDPTSPQAPSPPPLPPPSTSSVDLKSVDIPNLNFNDLPDNIRWEATGTDTGSNLVNLLGNQTPEITGAIIPFAEQNIAQNIFFMYQYPIMHYLDLLSQHMPWWVAIIATTASIRALFFPLVLKLNVMGIKIYNIMPETQALQVKMNEAMLAGDSYQTALYRTKLKLLYLENKVSVSQRLIPTFIQTPAFLCLFFTLKNLAGYYKIPALTVGGALWFSNLTIPDPFYALPIMTSLSILILFEKGLEGSTGPLNSMGPLGRWMFRCMPLGLFFVFQGFPSAVLLFWTTNNFITLCYALLFRNSWVKKKLDIPERLNHDPASLPLTNQTFSGQISKSIDKAKGSRTTMDLRKLDDIAFQKAGVGPLRKTYKNPPAQQREEF